MQRGEIWWANLLPPVGSAPGGHRPVLVLQADRINRTRINTVIVAIITSNINLATALGNVLLPATDSGLYRDSLVNVSQIATVNKYDLTEYVGGVSEEIMTSVEEGLKLVLGLE